MLAACSHTPLLRHHRASQRGLSFIYVILILFILMFFVAIAVDMGRVRVSKSQLQTATDAAAYAGVQALPFADLDLAINRAVHVAHENLTDGSAVVLQPNNDIQFGLYRITTRKFTPVGAREVETNHDVTESDANAIKVTANRIKSRNNPINLIFARLVTDNPAKTKFDIQTTAMAAVLGGPTEFGIVGIDFIKANGNTARIDSYNPALGPYQGQQPGHNATVASNGDINLGNGDIYGDARPGINGIVSQKHNSHVTGWTAPLDTPLNYAPAAIPGNAVTLPNADSIPGGVYKTTSEFPPKKTTTFSGPATVYVDANVDLKGNSVVTSGNLPANLKIIVVGSHNMDIGGNSKIYAQLYAPQSDLTIHGTPGFFGSIVAKSITFKGTSDIHYDESLNGSIPRRSMLVR